MFRRALLTPFICATLLTSIACDKHDTKEADKAKTETKESTDAKAGDANADADAGKTEAAPILVIGAAKIMQKDQPDKGIELAADGSVTIAGKPMGKVSADGKLSGVDGKVVMQVDAEGTVTSPDGQRAPMVVQDNGVTMEGPDGKKIAVIFAEDGSVKVEDKSAAPDAPPPPEFATEGCTGAVAKTCGLVFTAYMLLMPGEVVTDDSEASAPAVVPPQ
ncbi:MAG: hypothetical protein KC457_24585 [Myxococcales bacterium]|nr:hypothetical protein [Myxococcales bacterium]